MCPDHPCCTSNLISGIEPHLDVEATRYQPGKIIGRAWQDNLRNIHRRAAQSTIGPDRKTTPPRQGLEHDVEVQGKNTEHCLATILVRSDIGYIAPGQEPYTRSEEHTSEL